MQLEELLEYTDYLLGVAAGKCDSWDDAQDLVQTTVLEGLLAVRNGKKIDNARNWLVTVLNRRYYDMLREKYRKPLVFYGMSYDLNHAEAQISGPVDVGPELTEAENLRRLVARMTKQYREVLVQHYFRGLGIREIAEKLAIPESTVKSRLRLGRDKLRKELTMEKFEKQSFEPETLWISSSGSVGMDDEPYSLVKDDRIAMNLLILAYEKPVTLPELSDAIGISTAYIEPVVERLVNGELMKRAGDRVFTDFIIYTEEDRLSSLELQKELAARQFDAVWKIVEEGLDVLRNAAYYTRQNASARLKLEGYFAFKSVYRSVLTVRDEVAGKMPFSEYPDRRSGGKWFAMGNRYPADYDYDRCSYSKYNVSGEGGGYFGLLPGAASVGLFDYDTDDKVLGRSHSAYHSAGSSCDARECVIKLLYAAYRDDESLLRGIPGKTLENLDTLQCLDYLERTPEGKLKLNIPVVSQEEKDTFCGLANEYANKLAETCHEEFIGMIRHPVKVPKQIQNDVPGFLLYLNTYCYFPAAVILEARNRGRFLKGCDQPIPAVLMVVCEE